MRKPVSKDSFGEESETAAPLAPAHETQANAERDGGAVSETHAAGHLSASSPQAAPSAYGVLLGQLQGDSEKQASVLRQLQRTYGNRYVGKTLQAKLASAHPADAHEEEADRLAEQLTKEGKPEGSQAAGHRDRVPRFMQARLGTDLSDVRLHTDETSARLNRQLNAHAITTGRDIYFGAGKYNPQSIEGQRLLAHELVHVVQQMGRTANNSATTRDEERAASGSPAQLSTTPTGRETLQRQHDKSKAAYDPALEVRAIMDTDPFWSLEGVVYTILVGLDIASLLDALKSLLSSGHLTLLMQSPLISGKGDARLEMAAQAVLYKGRKGTPEHFGISYRSSLERLRLSDRLAILRYLGAVPEQPLGEVVKVGKTVYVIVEGQVRYGEEGDKTKTWRTNNPGALTVPQAVAPSPKEKALQESIRKRLENRAYEDKADPHGFKSDPHEGGAKLAVFATEELGKAALRDKLKAFQDSGATLEGFGMSQLGSKKLGAVYAQLMIDLLKQKRGSSYGGIGLTTRLSSIALDDLVAVTQRREGWNPEKKGVSVDWSDKEKLGELPLAVQFRVMLAEWQRQETKK